VIFEWDAAKARADIRKHGVSFEEARTVFGDPMGRIVDDPRHSSDERRYALLGLSEKQRLLAVMFTERDDAIRIISARRATRREKIEYEEKADQE
jgi:uncharacterized protein